MRTEYVHVHMVSVVVCNESSLNNIKLRILYMPLCTIICINHKIDIIKDMEVN